MKIDKQFLTISNYNRPGSIRKKTSAIACHYIGNPGTSAQANRNYFENLKDTHTIKASAHYIIGLNGEIIQMIPEEEISWATNSANSYTISIEACHPDETGKFNTETYNSYVELCADICKRWNLDPLNGGLIRHYDVTRKVCPKWFVDNPKEWEKFKQDVYNMMHQSDVKVGWVQENNGWRFYYRDGSGNYVVNDWYEDCGDWYWFDGAGMMVRNVWYQYHGHWYYLGSDGKMCDGLTTVDGKWYYLNEDGIMATEPIVLTPDKNGALQYPKLAQ